MKTAFVFLLLAVAPVFGEDQNPKADDFIQVWGIGFRRDAPKDAVMQQLRDAGISARANTAKGWESRLNLFRGPEGVGEIMFGTPTGHPNAIVIQAIQYWDVSEVPDVVRFAHKLIAALDAAADHTSVQPKRSYGITSTQVGSTTIGRYSDAGVVEQWATFSVGQREIHLTETDGRIDGKPFHSVEIKEYVIRPTDWLYVQKAAKL
jgi:hypothetical protein